jgi:O-antigen/teichoic acid export membrane protein
LKIKQFTHIAMGFLVGQGGMFIAQTLLISKGDFSTVGVIGISLGILSLLQWLADMGGCFLTTKYMNERQDKVISFFISRVIFVVPVAVIYYSIIFAWQFDGPVFDTLMFGGPVLLIGALNFSGFVDYKSLNNVVSIYSGLSWLIPAIFVVITMYSPMTFDIGWILGVGYLLGLFISVVIQWVYVRSYIIQMFFDYKLSSHDVKSTLMDGVMYNVSFVFSQSYGRAIPIVIEKFVGADATGIFVYTRNITNMFSQFSMFARRVEFDSLNKISLKDFSILKVISNQKLSLLISVFFMFSVVCVGLLVSSFGYDSELLRSLYWMTLIFVLFGISSFFSQYLIVIGKIHINSFVQVLLIASTFCSIYFFIDDYGIYSVYYSEVIMHLIRVGILLLIISHYRHKVS